MCVNFGTSLKLKVPTVQSKHLGRCKHSCDTRVRTPTSSCVSLRGVHPLFTQTQKKAVTMAGRGITAAVYVFCVSEHSSKLAHFRGTCMKLAIVVVLFKIGGTAGRRMQRLHCHAIKMKRFP